MNDENMSVEPGRKSHAMAWTLSIVGALFAYVASTGPEQYLETKKIITPPFSYRMADFYMPIHLLCGAVPALRGPFNSYTRWWYLLAGGNPDPLAVP